MSEDPGVRRLRRQYARQGLQLRSVPERSRWHDTYGPFMLVDRDNVVTAYGLDLDDLASRSPPDTSNPLRGRQIGSQGVVCFRLSQAATSVGTLICCVSWISASPALQRSCSAFSSARPAS